ncbi:hypothetical protein Nepgr_028800 [Nepenthes gracilis]|uniref:Uncharacterized protein n=1 Tax=Nepenthes gracilis TaxID=150966 RepID=A0AAD3TEB8_NEPGR|nr:hypothetical protein Nepgr_028800 [Nepenthes gracilis]
MHWRPAAEAVDGGRWFLGNCCGLLAAGSGLEAGEHGNVDLRPVNQGHCVVTSGEVGSSTPVKRCHEDMVTSERDEFSDEHESE